MGTSIAFGPWEPDKGEFNPDTIDTVLNMNPLSVGWGPFPELEEVGSSLGGECRGCWYARKSDGSFRLFAGTATELFLFDTATQTWSSVGGPYTAVPDGQIWQALQFGTKFIVVQLEAAPQVIDVDSGATFGNLGGTPPQAKYIWAAGDFVVLGYLKVGADEFPSDIHWSGLNDATYWTIDRKKGSDRQTLPDGNEVIGGFGFPGGARIIQKDAKRAMVFTGGAYIFELRVLDATRGAVGGIVAISADDYVFWRTDGIYRGDANIPLGAQRVDDFLLDQIEADADVTSLDTVQGVADPFNKTVMWAYLGSDGAKKVIAWDWELDRFFRLDVAPLLLFSAVVPGYTLEGMDAIHASLDDFTPEESFDSRRWKGGAPTIGAFTVSNTLAYFTGGAADGLIETNTLELNPDMRTFVNGCRIKGNPGTNSDMQIGKATLHDDTLTWSSTSSRSSRTGTYPFRVDARLHRFRVNTAAGDTTFTHLHGISADAQPSGEA